jgi:aubergine-like protein
MLIQNKKELQIPVQLSISKDQQELIQVNLKWTGHQKAALNKESIMFFCTRFKAAMAAQKDRVAIGSDYFNLDQVENVPEYYCQLAPGLDCTLYATKCGPIVNTDLMFKHIRTDTMYDIIAQMRSRGHATDDAISLALSHKVVMPSYWDPKRSVIIDRVRFDMSPQSKFDKKGQQVTYAQYMREKYGIKNGDLDKPQPMLESVSRKERDRDGNFKVTHFIPSLCHLTGATEEMKQDRTRGRELIKKTALPPGDRISKIAASVKSMVQNADFNGVMQPWGIKMTSALLRIPARRLPTPAMRNGTSNVEINSSSESWQVKWEWPMFMAKPFEKWAVLCTYKEEPVRQFVDALMKVARDLHIPISQPSVFDTQDQRPRAYMQKVQTDVKKLEPDFLVVVVPRNTDEPYKSVKQFLGREAGIPSQFVTMQNIQKDVMTKATKVILQMNCKAGGAPWTVDMKLAKPTMIVGLDVHHGGDLEHKAGSVAGFVATMNRECTQYYSRTFQVKPREQVLAPYGDGPGLKKLISEALESFKKNNKLFPKYVVVYRDGGSEGELKRIEDYEVKQIRDAIKEVAGDDCKLTFFVVLKKIRTRYFMINPENQREVANPFPGTVVDTNITNGYIPEFFLCCQHVNQGSATPTKYQKIYDDSELTAMDLQMYTYCQAHMYFNWNGTIRVPAVVKYASTLAKFTGQFLQGREVMDRLWSKLHYL